MNTVVFCADVSSLPDAVVVEIQEVEVSNRLRVITESTNSFTVLNPVQSVRPIYAVPEGTVVSNGQLLVEFDSTRIRRSYTNLLQNLNILEKQWARSRADRAMKLLVHSNELERLQDLKTTVEAELEGLKTRPYPEDVRIAKGRWNVAETQWRAATQDVFEVQHRFARGLVSEADVKREKRALERREVEKIYALAGLEVAKQKADPRETERRRIQIANYGLQISEKRKDLEELISAGSTKVQTYGKRLNKQHDRVKEKESELERLHVRAPQAGAIIYSGRFKRRLAEGERPSEGDALMDITDSSSQVFHCTLTEKQRSLYRVGDRGVVRLRGSNRAIEVELFRLKSLPRNLAEEEGISWLGKSEEGGVKVYDGLLRPLAAVDNIPLGVSGEVELRGQVLKAPAVPLQWVIAGENSFRVFCDDRFHEVKGRQIGSWFVFDDEEWLGRRILMQAPEQSARAEAESTGEEFAGDQLVVSGELVPADAVTIRIPVSQARNRRVLEIVENDTWVDEGEFLAELSNQELEAAVERWEDQLDATAAELLQAREAIEARERAFAVSRNKAENDVSFARLGLDLLENPAPDVRDARAERDVALARVAAEETKDAVERAREQGDLVSPVRLRTLERELKRANLNLEGAELALEKVRRGADKVQRSSARLLLQSKQVALEELVREQNGEVQIDAIDLERRELEHSRTKRILDRIVGFMEGNTIYAPASGQVSIGNTWDGAQWVDITTGSRVWSRLTLLTLSNTDRMYLKVMVDEQYYSKIKEGMKVEVVVPSSGGEPISARVSTIDFLFQPRLLSNQSPGLYDQHEIPGPHQMELRVDLDEKDGSATTLQPGTIAYVVFPFES